jgi:hypothetical protein
MGEQLNRLRNGGLLSSLNPFSAYFSPYLLSAWAPVTLPQAKPDDTAAERRSISASGNALAINVILKAAMMSPPQIAKVSCTLFSIASAAVGDPFAQPVTALTRFSDRSL